MPSSRVLRGADPRHEAHRDLRRRPVPTGLHCSYCGYIMKLAWPAPSDPASDKGHIMACDWCHATCQAVGGKNWDWREGRR